MGKMERKRMRTNGLRVTHHLMTLGRIPHGASHDHDDHDGLISRMCKRHFYLPNLCRTNDHTSELWCHHFLRQTPRNHNSAAAKGPYLPAGSARPLLTSASPACRTASRASPVTGEPPLQTMRDMPTNSSRMPIKTDDFFQPSALPLEMPRSS